jgi:hypothetical protein
LKRFGKQIGIRITKDFYDLLNKVANSRGEDISDFARRAIYKELASLSFLPDDQKKALGMNLIHQNESGVYK